MSYRDKCLNWYPERCVSCGSDEDIVVHHVNGDRSNNSLLNLIPVCKSCHSAIHTGNHPIWSEKLRETDVLQLDPVVEDRSWSMTIYRPFIYRKMIAGSRGRVTLGKKYEGEPIGVAITPLQ